jgi:hypothetical protein
LHISPGVHKRRSPDCVIEFVRLFLSVGVGVGVGAETVDDEDGAVSVAVIIEVRLSPALSPRSSQSPPRPALG